MAFVAQTSPLVLLRAVVHAACMQARTSATVEPLRLKPVGVVLAVSQALSVGTNRVPSHFGLASTCCR